MRWLIEGCQRILVMVQLELQVDMIFNLAHKFFEMSSFLPANVYSNTKFLGYSRQSSEENISTGISFLFLISYGMTDDW